MRADSAGGLRLKRLALLAGLVAVLLAASGFAVQSAEHGFVVKLASAQRQLDQEQQAGVPAEALSPLRDKLHGIEQARFGPVPAGWLPYGSPSAQIDAVIREGRTVWDRTMSQDRPLAAASLQALVHADPNLQPASKASYQQRIDGADSPAALVQLASELRDKATSAATARKAVSDLQAKRDALATAIEKAKARGLQVDAALKAVADYDALTTLPADQIGDRPAAVGQALDTETAGLGGRQTLADLQPKRDALAALIATAKAKNIAVDDAQKAVAAYDALKDLPLDQATQQASAVAASINAQTASLQKKIKDADNPPPTTGGTGGCLPNMAAGHVIIVRLATQHLDAYDNGCLYMSMPITTGRPALPTDQGTFHVFYKTTNYKMISPWPKPSPYWYPTVMVPHVIEFVSDGTFLHDSPWEPDSAMGPGSQNGPSASHGCVHIPSYAINKLYDWAQIGDTVISQP